LRLRARLLISKIQITAVGALARLNRAVILATLLINLMETEFLNYLPQFYLTNGMKCQLLRLGLAMTLSPMAGCRK
jgi:hypothetical protein